MISIAASLLRSTLARSNKFWARGRELKERGVAMTSIEWPQYWMQAGVYSTVEGLATLPNKLLFVMCHSYIG